MARGARQRRGRETRAEDQEGRPNLGLSVEAAGTWLPGEERVGEEALAMVVVLGARAEEGAL